MAAFQISKVECLVKYTDVCAKVGNTSYKCKYLEKPTLQEQPKRWHRLRPLGEEPLGWTSPRTGQDVANYTGRRQLGGASLNLHLTPMPWRLLSRWWRFKATSPACLFVGILPQTRKEAVAAAFKACVGCEVTEALKKDERGPPHPSSGWTRVHPPLRSARTHRLPVSVCLCECRPPSLPIPPSPSPLGGGGKRRATWPKPGGHQ